MEEIKFLTLVDVEYLHHDQLERHGGQDGYLDKGVVESAIAQPKQTMFGEYLHRDIPHMAAAYLFHLATTQGFLDGNKRTALICASAFLQMNGYELDVEDDSMYPIAMAVANNQMTKDELADWMQQRIRPLSSGA